MPRKPSTPWYNALRPLPSERSSTDEEKRSSYLRVQEVIDEDEEAFFEYIHQKLMRQLTSACPAGSGQKYGTNETFDPITGRHFALATVELEIARIDHLPAELQCGIFGRKRTFNGVMKFNWLPSASVSRLCVKLLAGENGQEPMDFIFSNGVAEGGSSFFVNNMYDFDLLTDFSEKRFNKNFLNPKNLVALFRILNVLKDIVPRMRGRYDDVTPLEETYFAMLPYALGPSAVRYKLVPQQQPANRNEPANAQDLGDRIERMVLGALESDQSFAFDFCAQIATPDGTPGPIRCIEEASVSWTSPWHTIGTLRIQGDDSLQSMEEKWGPRTRWPEVLHFNPAHTPSSWLPNHRPVGQSGRLRSYLYERRFKERVSHLYGTGSCPYSARVLLEKTSSEDA